MQICELSLVLICIVLMLLTLMWPCSKPCVRMITLSVRISHVPIGQTQLNRCVGDSHDAFQHRSTKLRTHIVVSLGPYGSYGEFTCHS